MPLTEPEQIDAAWRSTVRNPALGEGEGRGLGTSLQGEKNEGKTPLPAEAPAENSAENGDGEARAAAAGLLGRLTARDGRLRLGALEALDLAPLVADRLARDPDVERLRAALLDGLPPQVPAPAGFLRSRLERKMPEPTGPTPPAAIGECVRCAAPVTPGGGTICRRCAGLMPPAAAPDRAAAERNRIGAEFARGLLRGAAPVPVPAPVP